MTTAERLRNQGPIPSLIACRQAADELDRNQDTIAQLRAERDKAYKLGLLRAAQVCRELGPVHGWKEIAKAIEAEAQKGQP